MTTTKFTNDFTTTKIICYICGCECCLIGSRQHERFCLLNWFNEHHGNEYYAPQQPIPYPDPFTASENNIHMYNKKAESTARLCKDITPTTKKNLDVKKITALGLQHPNNLIQPKRFIRHEEQDYTTRKKYPVKVGSFKKKYEKPPKIILHEVLVNTMRKYAPLLPEVPEPGRIPREHIYAYNLDELNSTATLILKPCYIASEELIRRGVPTQAGLASRRPVRISPKIATI